MNFLSFLKKFSRHKQGNVLITFALAIVPVLFSVGMMIDYSEGARLRTKIASATDAALMAAASSLMQGVDLNNQSQISKQLRKIFEPFFLANMPSNSRYKYHGFDISYNAISGGVDVDVRYKLKTYMMGIAGKPSLNVQVSAATSIQMSSGGAVSMYLVLDKSGSMDWQGKMYSLKSAVRDMTKQFESIDPKHEYVRMGAISYDTKAQKETPITWGTSATNYYVQSLRAFGGTSSTKAIKNAYKALRHPREVKLHQAKSEQDPTKVMVFMTDGSNNDSKDDKQTIKFCNKAKNNNIEIFTVAFKAPYRGQQLLASCASDPSHYFNATNSQDLTNAFRRIGAATAENLIFSK